MERQKTDPANIENTKEDGRMRLIDADELMEHAARDRLDSRELIMQMIENAPTALPRDLLDYSPEELIKLSRKQKVQIEIRFEPDGYGKANRTMIIQPWEEYTPYCPHGVPIVQVREGGGS